MDESSHKALISTLLIVVVMVAGTVLLLRKYMPDTYRHSANPFQNKNDRSSYPKNTADKLEVLSLLKSKQFAELNQLLQKYQSEYERDYRNEYIVFDAIVAFDIDDSSIVPLLQEWSLATPDSYFPHLAIALYEHNLGWRSRGGKWARETTEDQFAGMLNHFDAAEREGRLALRKNPKLLAGYWILINIYNAEGDHEKTTLAFHQGSQQLPESLILRAAYMNSLKPRWGGSYREMEEFAAESQKLVSRNPDLQALFGFVSVDKGSYLDDEEKYDEAISMVSKGMQYGEYWEFLEERARIYCKKGQLDLAIKDLNRAVGLRPQRLITLALRGYAFSRAGRYDRAAEDFKVALMIDPQSKEVLSRRSTAITEIRQKAYTLSKSGKQNEALELCNQALSIDPSDAKTLWYRADASFRKGDRVAAFADLEQSIRLDPHLFESYRYMDRMLAQDGKWDDIIALWDRFLAEEPQNANGFFERSGAYYHRGDLTNAMQDLKSACDLGNTEACNQQQRLVSHR